MVDEKLWSAMRFLSEPLDTPIPSQIWAWTNSAGLLTGIIEKARASFAEENRPETEFEAFRREEQEWEPDPLDSLYPGIELTGLRRDLVSMSQLRGRTLNGYARTLDGSLEDWLDLPSPELEERCVSILVAKQAESRFEIDRLRLLLRTEPRSGDQRSAVAALYTNGSNAGLNEAKVLDSKMDALLKEDEDYGATKRSLWMPLARRLLSDQGYWYLSYREHGSDSPTSMVLTRDRMPGTSWRLPLLSKAAIALSVRYDWDLSQSTTFVLTGRTPLSQGTRTMAIEGQDRPSPRFEMIVDAGVTPAEVAQAYIAARSSHIKGYKGIGRKHAALATFASQFDNEGQANWKGTMDAWNAWAVQHLATDGKATYGNLALFKRDVQQARSRLLRLGDD